MISLYLCDDLSFAVRRDWSAVDKASHLYLGKVDGHFHRGEEIEALSEMDGSGAKGKERRVGDGKPRNDVTHKPEKAPEESFVDTDDWYVPSAECRIWVSGP
jgi:hypothetical protein